MKRLAGLVLLGLAQIASADVLYLQSGKTIRMDSYSIDGASIRVVLSEKGEMAFPLEWVREIRITPPEQKKPAAISVMHFDNQYSDLILSASNKHSVDWKLIAAIMAAESNFNPAAVSPKGALGLMQLMPDTARSYRVRNPHNPQENVEAGVKHLKSLISRYQGKLELALAAYNAGEKAVDRYGGIPPYDETRQYIKRVMKFYRGLSST